MKLRGERIPARAFLPGERGYYPECNVLMPVWHHAVGSKTPAAKSVPVSVHSDGDAVLAPQMEYATG